MIRGFGGRKAEGTRDLLRAGNNTGTVALLVMLAAICYALLVTAGGSIGLFAPVVPYGLTFNSMLLHLLQGRFDVDPAAIGPEGFIRDGAVYAYFGIFPALFRALFLPLPNFATTDFTRLSCLVAASLMALFKVRSVLLVWRRAGAPRHSVLLALLLAVILASGPQIQFLRPWIFEESLLWAGAFASIFVFLVLRGWAREEGFTTRLMSALAVVAGACLLTRVSTALGLYLALGFIWLWRAWQETRHPGDSALWRRLLSLALPLVILMGFAAMAAIINQQRWGNPFVFVDLNRSLILAQYPDRLMRLHEYGEFNLARLGYGLLYYFLPVWVLRDGSGQLLWSDFVERTIDAVELPPSSFLVSDPLIIGLAVYGIVRLARGSEIPSRAPIVLTAIALLVPIVLILIAISMTFRYRLEFYPLFELCAFIGFWCLLVAPKRRVEIIFGAAALVSILAAQALWILNTWSPSGPAGKVMGQSGIVDYYESLLK